MPVKQITFLKPKLGAGVDGVAGGLEHLLAVLGVVEALDERRVGAHVDRADRARQPVLLEQREELGGHQLDAVAAELLGDLGRLVHVPVLLEAPVDDGLLDPAVFHGTLRGWRILGRGLAPERRHAEHGRAGGLLEHPSAAAPPRPVIRVASIRLIARSFRFRGRSFVGRTVTDPIRSRYASGRRFSRLDPGARARSVRFVSDLATRYNDSFHAAPTRRNRSGSRGPDMETASRDGGVGRNDSGEKTATDRPSRAGGW